MTRFVPLALLLVACSGAADSDAGGPGLDAGADAAALPEDAGAADADASDSAAPEGGAPTPTPREALEAAGFDLADGELRAIDLEDCCATGRSCSGNNPSSPYLAVYLPRGPGQTAPNFKERPDGTSSGVRLREDEAVVLVGRTPPPVAYFGFTPYLVDGDYGTGTRRVPFASLTETLNHETVGVDGPDPYGERFAIVATGNATTEARVRAALIEAGYPTEAINLITVDPRLFTFGLDDSADTFGLLCRVALFDDPVAGQAWVDDPGATVLRVTPATPGAPDPLPSPLARPKNTTVDENAGGTLEAALDRLEAAIQATHAGDTISQYVTNAGTFDSETCIENGTPCLGDNRDALYPGLGTTAFRIGNGDSVYVLGVDHTVTGKATYASASVYALSHLLGLAAATSADWRGSAVRFLPDDPDAASLFAYRFARDCTGDAWCVEVPTGACPDGAGLLQMLTVVFRIYVEPGTATAPDPGLVVRDRVLYVRPGT